jgi:LPXTG-motif cell wall-anchored protein
MVMGAFAVSAAPAAAVSGVATPGKARAVQYATGVTPTPTTTSTPSRNGPTEFEGSGAPADTDDQASPTGDVIGDSVSADQLDDVGSVQTPATKLEKGSLPFTGQDALAVGGLALLLLASGLVLRRRTSRST